MGLLSVWKFTLAVVIIFAAMVIYSKFFDGGNNNP